MYQHKENNVTVMMTAQNIYDNQQLLSNLAGFDTLTQHEHHQSLLHQSAQHMQHAAQSLADSIVQPFSQSFLSQAAGIGNHVRAHACTYSFTLRTDARFNVRLAECNSSVVV